MMVTNREIWEFSSWSIRLTALLSTAIFYHPICLGTSGSSDTVMKLAIERDPKALNDNHNFIREQLNRFLKWIRNDYYWPAWSVVDHHIYLYQDMGRQEFANTLAGNLSEKYPFRQWQVVTFTHEITEYANYYIDDKGLNARAWIKPQGNCVFVSSVLPDHYDYSAQVGNCRYKFINFYTKEETKNLIHTRGEARMIGEFIQDKCMQDYFNGSYSGLLTFGGIPNKDITLDYIKQSESCEDDSLWAFWYWFDYVLVVPYDPTVEHSKEEGDYCGRGVHCDKLKHCCGLLPEGGAPFCCEDVSSCVGGKCIPTPAFQPADDSL